jgi:endo-1,4-beta-xylanase
VEKTVTCKILLRLFISAVFFISFFPSCAKNEKSNIKTLKDAYKGKFYIGTAVSEKQISGADAESFALIKAQFNSMTPENLLKWEIVHPFPGKYNFGPVDKFVDVGTESNMFLAGHTLVWHSQTPAWVFEDKAGNSAGKELLISRMKEHITTVVGRYKGKIQGWDVVNEALNDDGTLKSSKWKEIIGDEYIEIAFKTANECDPDAELYYNDYNLWMPAKRAAALKIIKKLLDKGIRIDGVGMQGHWSLNSPGNEEIEACIKDFGAIGMKVMITELDINVLPNPWDYSGADVNTRFELKEGINPYTTGLPDSVSSRQAARYAELFRLFLNNRKTIERVTFWGVHDGQSWKNNWPVRGRTDYPLLFDRQLKPKPAFYAIIKLTE